MGNILEPIVAVLWGWPLTVSLLGLGAYLTIRSKFWAFRHFGHCVKHLLSGGKKEEDYNKSGKLTGFKAFAIATGAAVGVGNIGGVSSAIALGGPGVLFWMWVTALVGMTTKMAEVTLGLHYRSVDQKGKTFGGPTYYIEKGFKEIGMIGGPILATTFALSLFIELFFGMENFTVSEAVASTFNLPQIPVAIAYFIVGKAIILSGVKFIGKLAHILIPFMSVFYIIGGVITIGMTFENLPHTFELIIKGAFTPMAAVGGFAGSAMILTMRTGIARGLYSNEAGWGTSPMAHSTADVDHPIEQGMMGVVEVFFDTIIICSITGIVIVNTGAWETGLSGATLALHAFSMGMGPIGGVVLTIALVLFCLTTGFSWFVFFETVLRYLFKDNNKLKEIMVWVLKLFLHGTPSLILTLVTVSQGMVAAEVWLFSDIASSIPTYINIFAVFLLSGKYFTLLKHYNKTKLDIPENVDDDLVLFSPTKMPYELKDEVERDSSVGVH